MALITWHLSINKRILHIVFPKLPRATVGENQTYFLKAQKNPCQAYQNSILCKNVLAASARYEGPNQFVGFNVPITSITPEDTVLWQICQQYPTLQYMVAYIEGDTSTIAHELRHARFYIDTAYRARVEVAWKRIQLERKNKYKTIIKRLEDANYQPRVFMDEFQAYYPNLIEELA